MFQSLNPPTCLCNRPRRAALPSDFAGSLLVTLHVGHRAVAVAQGVHAHEVVAAVVTLVGLVEVGEGRHHVGQRAQVALTWVILGNGGAF